MKLVICKLILIALCLCTVSTHTHAESDREKELRYKLKKQQVEKDINEMKMALVMYKMHIFRFPTLQEGVEALVGSSDISKPKNYPKGGFLKRVPVDPWGNNYQYSIKPKPHFYSLGEDGKIGGTGFDKDIHIE